MILTKNLRINTIRAMVVVTLGIGVLLSAPSILQAKSESNSQSMLSRLATPPIPPSPSVTPVPVTPPTPPNPGPKNHAPVITTRTLPNGKVGKKYVAHISATDRDGDKMKMEMYNLPKDLVLGSCKNRKIFGRSFITCEVVGKPKSKFSGTVTAVVTDNQGEASKKEFKLQIK